jgi:hypothetical protein
MSIEPQLNPNNGILGPFSFVATLLFSIITQVSWFQGQPYHLIIH